MSNEAGLRRIVSFSDGVVAIAITLLILPLVDSASSIGSDATRTILHDDKLRLFAFFLSFAVIGRFWWSHHQMFERVQDYNAVLVTGMFVWLLSIVFLPYPTELISAAKPGNERFIDGLYVGVLIVTALAAYLQEWCLVRWPQLQTDESRGTARLDSSAILVLLMAVAFVVAVATPVIGLWSLLLLLLSTPIEHLVAARRARDAVARTP